jgi:hypothetical protein
MLGRGRFTRRVCALLVFLCGTSAWSSAGASTEDEFSKRAAIQPGAGIYNPYLDTHCTMGFLLKDSAGAVYGVTEGNCAPNGMFRDGGGVYTPYVGSRTWATGRGPVVQRYERQHRQFGRYVAQVLTDNAYHLNYAIVRLDRGVGYDGTVAVVGGPGRQPYTGEATGPTQVTFVCIDGYEVMWGETRPAYDDGVHQDVAPTGIASPAFELATPSNGNCGGAPVVAFDGAAVGIHSRYLGGGGTTGLAEGRGGPPAYRLDAIISAAQKQLGVSLRLVQSGEKGTTRR